MVVLLRSPRHKVEAYVKEFGRLGIPLAATRGGFYESLEVRDLLGLLQVLDNPLQDLPLLGVLRSPLVGLTADELAVIRIWREHGRFWTALLQWHKTTEVRAAAYDKAHEFLRRFEDWRRLSRQSAVSHCLECVIDQTHYGDWIATQERGEQKRANVERLLQLTRQFDAYDGESLYRFLRFVEARQESEAGRRAGRRAGGGGGPPDEHSSKQRIGISHRRGGGFGQALQPLRHLQPHYS